MADRVKTDTLTKEAKEAVREARLGLKSGNLQTAKDVVTSLETDDLLKMYKFIQDELNTRVGETPTAEERWLVNNGDKVTAVRMVRSRLSCDLDTALKVLSLI